MPTVVVDFSQRLESLDLTLFDGVPTQSEDGDRQSWLAVQRSVRRPAGYTYLEIGSHLGGSIQQHLIDPWCQKIISIDKRSLNMPDDRGETVYYEGNFTARMLDNLSRIARHELSKVICFDADAKDVDPHAIPAPPDFCFIDGEHTYAAVISDFEFCLRVCAPNAAICFHDDRFLYGAVGAALTLLRHRRIPFSARKLGGDTFGIFLRDCNAANDAYVRDCSRDGVRWILWRRIRAMVKASVPEWSLPAIRWAVRRFRA